ncbi:MAG: BREX-4 system phosphatase PglZ [Bacteroidales bacterium]|nr:BREX-4 system phosphatase PglZ [Bacteroidales bacterium]
MYKEDFHNISELIEFAKADKQIGGDMGFVANRYPIRFVLFDNFSDSFEFIQQMHCFVESVEKWFDTNYTDIMMTHTALSDNLSRFIASKSDTDVIIAPFSELARFYNNKNAYEFDALIRTIKTIESNPIGFQNKQRVYIPIVGLEGKMSMFAQDSQINIWYFKNGEKHINYKLILTQSTFDVNNLEEKYTIVDSVKQWMTVWRDQNAKHKIISTSKALLANAEYAQPDNAFDFCTCNNVYEFLTIGLGLDFGEIEYKPNHNKHWQRLAKEIDVSHFSFEDFFNHYFHIDELADYNVFLKTWFDCDDDFEKWLLCTYYLDKFCNQKSYICKSIQNSRSYNTVDFFASVTLSIFDCEEKEYYVDERKLCMAFAAKNGVIVSNEVEEQLKKELEKVARQHGCNKAIKYFTQLTHSEKVLVIEWLGQNKIEVGCIIDVYPDLYHYATGTIEGELSWISDYFKAYRNSKISNAVSNEVEQLLYEQNSSHVSFNNWYNSFKTTKTILSSRTDIEVFYWIDGLGIEWIPYISYLLSKKEGVFLNEIHIARSAYPTITANNKASLEALSHNDLKKIGDLDSHAHINTNKYPNYIIEEFEIINKAVSKIVNEYSGKKIAIISDHGITAMSQYCNGLNLAGFSSDHGGRLAIKENGKPNADNSYIICDDNKTVCALKYSSLCAKIPTGQSAHGGCTPEEILVPIIIISSQKETCSYSIKLLSAEITGNNPVVEFEIKGDNVVNPYILYGNNRYNLTKTGDIYRSDNLVIVAATRTVTLYIGTACEQTFDLKINIGAEEDDLFDF